MQEKIEMKPTSPWKKQQNMGGLSAKIDLSKNWNWMETTFFTGVDDLLTAPLLRRAGNRSHFNPQGWIRHFGFSETWWEKHRTWGRILALHMDMAISWYPFSDPNIILLAIHIPWYPYKFGHIFFQGESLLPVFWDWDPWHLVGQSLLHSVVVFCRHNLGINDIWVILGPCSMFKLRCKESLLFIQSRFLDFIPWWIHSGSIPIFFTGYNAHCHIFPSWIPITTWLSIPPTGLLVIYSIY